METVICALIAAASASVVAPVVTYLLTRRKGHDESLDAIKQGMRALLWRELMSIYRQAVANGGLTVDERNHLQDVYSAYHAIGGNGTGTRLYEDAMETQVLD